MWLFRWKWLFDPLIKRLGSPPSKTRLLIGVILLVTGASAALAGLIPFLFFYVFLAGLIYLLIAFFLGAAFDANLHRTLVIVHLDSWVIIGPSTKAQDLLPRIPHAKIRFLFSRKELAKINRLVPIAVQRDLSYRPPDFRRMLLVLLGPYENPDPTLHQLDAVAQTYGIQRAYVDGAIQPADDPPENTNPGFQNQRYLFSAPEGIDAQYAWTVAGGRAEGTSFIDIEAGWHLDSPDLMRDGKQIENLNLISSEDGSDHGTQVLGIIMAQNNDIDVIGIAHNVTTAKVAGYRAMEGNPALANALLSASNALATGDVISLPDQRFLAPHLPVEITPAHFQMIRLATALGIVVVEAAGNNNSLLDNDQVPGQMTLNVDAPLFEDSGAIMVAGADSTSIPNGLASLAPPPGPDRHARHATSNYGNRIDVYAWGNNVVSINGFFAGTSAATPIIAGAALSVQGVLKNRGQAPLDSMEMRSLLQYLGTPSDPPASGPPEPIGVMPNLRSVLEYLQYRPSPYIRDRIGDDGSAHELRDCFESPDIFIRPDPDSIADLDTTAEEPLDAGVEQFVYLRFQNSGLSDADIDVEVFEIPNSTIPLPSDFRSVGKTSITVPVGEPTVPAALPWTPTASAHGLLVTFSAPDKPELTPKYFQVRRNFGNILRRRPNVACRNFRTVTNAPLSLTDNPVTSSAIVLEFTAPVLEKDPAFSAGFVQLDIDHDLPNTAGIWLEGPLEFMSSAASPQNTDTASLRAWLNFIGPVTLYSVTVSPTSPSLKFRMLIQLQPEDMTKTFQIQVTQLNGAEAAGQIGWNLVP
jgi:serine protease